MKTSSSNQNTCDMACAHTQIIKLSYIKNCASIFWAFSLATYSACTQSSQPFSFPSIIISPSGTTLFPEPLVHPLKPAVYTAAKTILQSHKSNVTAPLPKTTRMKPNPLAFFRLLPQMDPDLLGVLHDDLLLSVLFFPACRCLFSVESVKLHPSFSCLVSCF